MATNPGLKDQVRKLYLQKVLDFLSTDGEDVKKVANNAIAFPTVDSEGNEIAVKVTIQIPLGSHEGEAYDVYQEAQDYEIEREAMAKKKAEAEVLKAKKIEADKKRRAEAAARKAEKEAEKKAALTT